MAHFFVDVILSQEIWYIQKGKILDNHLHFYNVSSCTVNRNVTENSTRHGIDCDILIFVLYLLIINWIIVLLITSCTINWNVPGKCTRYSHFYGAKFRVVLFYLYGQKRNFQNFCISKIDFVMSKHTNKSHKKTTADGDAKCYAYLTTFGTYEYVSGKKKSKQFERENAEIISQRITFSNARESKQHKKRFDAQKNNLVTPPRQKKQTEAQKAQLQAALKKIEDERPGPRLQVHWKTASRTPLTVFCLRYLNGTGKDDWRIKGDGFAIGIKHYVEVFGSGENPVVDGALSSLDFGRMRDPEGSPTDALVQEWSPEDKSKVYKFNKYVMHGAFPIPVGSEVTNKAEEDAYNEHTCTEIATTILGIMKDFNFRECYKHAINKESQWAPISVPDNPNKQFWTYADDAKPMVLRCPNFNKHLVQEDASAAVGKLFLARLPEVKYGTDDSVTSDMGSTKTNTDSESNTDTDDSPPTKRHKAAKQQARKKARKAKRTASRRKKEESSDTSVTSSDTTTEVKPVQKNQKKGKKAAKQNGRMTAVATNSPESSSNSSTDDDSSTSHGMPVTPYRKTTPAGSKRKKKTKHQNQAGTSRQNNNSDHRKKPAAKTKARKEQKGNTTTSSEEDNSESKDESSDESEISSMSLPSAKRSASSKPTARSKASAQKKDAVGRKTAQAKKPPAENKDGSSDESDNSSRSLPNAKQTTATKTTARSKASAQKKGTVGRKKAPAKKPPAKKAPAKRAQQKPKNAPAAKKTQKPTSAKQTTTNPMTQSEKATITAPPALPAKDRKTRANSTTDKDAGTPEGSPVQPTRYSGRAKKNSAHL